MELIVEDGSCKPGADSWVTLADANAHFANYGGFWDGSDSDKEAALRRAALWMSTSLIWSGTKSCSGNRLAWPRSGTSDCDGNTIPDDAIPDAVVLAQLAAASAELASPGILTPTITPGQQVLREKVDVLEVQYMTPLQQGVAPSTYDATVALRPVMTQISDYLRCLANVGQPVPWPKVV